MGNTDGSQMQKRKLTTKDNHLGKEGIMILDKNEPYEKTLASMLSAIPLSF